MRCFVNQDVLNSDSVLRYQYCEYAMPVSGLEKSTLRLKNNNKITY